MDIDDDLADAMLASRLVRIELNSDKTPEQWRQELEIPTPCWFTSLAQYSTPEEFEIGRGQVLIGLLEPRCEVSSSVAKRLLSEWGLLPASWRMTLAIATKYRALAAKHLLAATGSSRSRGADGEETSPYLDTNGRRVTMAGVYAGDRRLWPANTIFPGYLLV